MLITNRPGQGVGVSLPAFAPTEGAKHPGHSSHCCSSGSVSGQAALGIFYSVGPGGAQGGVQQGWGGGEAMEWWDGQTWEGGYRGVPASRNAHTIYAGSWITAEPPTRWAVSEFWGEDREG